MIPRALLAVLLLAVACRAKDEGAPPRPAAAAEIPAEPALGFIDESKEGEPRNSRILRRRLEGDPATLNAVLQAGLPEQQVLQYVSRNLLDFDAGMNLTGGLVESWETSADGRELTFRLRPEAVWEDGRPVTARDAAYTIQKIVDPKVPSPVYKPVFDSFDSVMALSDRDFRVRFHEPYAHRDMAFVLPLLPERRFAGKRFERAPDNRAPFSNGPYRFVRWKAQESIELERNPRYWGPRAHFDRVLFRVIPENAVAYRALLEESLDEAWRIDAGLKARAAAEADFRACCRLVEFYSLDYNYVALNNRSPFFDDARVRRAVTMLLDRPAIVRSLYAGSARIISGPWAPDSAAYDATVPPLPFDTRAAAALLSEAGWRDADGDGVREKGGRRFDFELLVSAGSTIGRQMDEMLSAELGKVGVRARIRPLEWGAFIERVDAGDFEAASLAWSASDPNPDPYFYWHSSQCSPAGLNSGCYRSREADALMEAARREGDSDRRREIYHRLHRLFRDDAPAVFVVTPSQKHAFRRRIRGLVTSPIGFSTYPGPLGWWASDVPAPGPPS